MKTLYPYLAFVLALTGSAFADLPYSGNIIEGQVPTNVTVLSVGNIPDGSVPATAQSTIGVPGLNLVEYALDAPPAADADYFANDLVVSSTGEKVSSFLKTAPTVNTATGQPFVRNVVVTPSGATTGTLVLRVMDAQGKLANKTFTFTASSAAQTSAWTCRQIISANVTTAFSNSRTLDIGTGLVFGLNYPMYANTVQADFFDTDGTGYPKDDPTTTTLVVGAPATSTADPYGTVQFAGDVPDGVNDYILWYIPTFTWRPDPSDGYPTTAWDLR